MTKVRYFPLKVTEATHTCIRQILLMSQLKLHVKIYPQKEDKIASKWPFLAAIIIFCIKSQFIYFTLSAKAFQWYMPEGCIQVY